MMETLRGGCCLTREAAYLNIDLNGTPMREKTASVCGPDPHVMYSTVQPKANCDDTSHHTYCSLLLGNTCVQCLYTVVYKSNQVDRYL